MPRPLARALDAKSAYIEMALEPEIQRIMLLDGPAVLGDPSKWPGQNACLQTTTQTIQALIDEGTVNPWMRKPPPGCSMARPLARRSGSPRQMIPVAY